MGWKNWVVTIFILLVIIGGGFMTIHANSDYRIYNITSVGVGKYGTVIVLHDIEQNNTCYVLDSIYESSSRSISCVKDSK